jgi:hypothetical protein
MLFTDANQQITISSGGTPIVIPRATFLTLEPTYQLPEGVSSRYFDGHLHFLDGEAGQTLAGDYSGEAMRSFCLRIDSYKKTLGMSAGEPAPIPQIGDKSYKGLSDALRGTAAWSKVFLAMGTTLRCNAAGSLLLAAITSTHNDDDLKAGFLALLDAMASQVTAPEFTDEEHEQIREALRANNFDVDSIYPPT